jgi:molecular chaperone Hsp33
MADTLVPFVVEGAGVRGAVARVDATVAAALAAHPFPPALRNVLGELATATVLLAASLKFSGALIVQLAGRGPVRLAVVESTDALELRATAQWDDGAVASFGDEATLAQLAGEPGAARLAITVDPRDGAPFQGIVAIEPGSVASMIGGYLERSAQVESRLVLARDGAQHGGVLVQRMPAAAGDDPAAWDGVARAAEALDPARLLGAHDAHAAIRAIAGERDARVFAAREPRFACRCSPARAARAIAIAGADEIEAALAERGDIEITCEYCGRRYTYTAAQARAIVAGR